MRESRISKKGSINNWRHAENYKIDLIINFEYDSTMKKIKIQRSSGISYIDIEEINFLLRIDGREIDESNINSYIEDLNKNINYINRKVEYYSQIFNSDEYLHSWCS